MTELYALPCDLALVVFLLGVVLLDALFGDPQHWPHPVRWLGGILNGFESWARQTLLGPGWGGCGAVLALALGAMIVVGIVINLPFLGPLLALYLGYAGLALGCLLREVTQVLRLLDGQQWTAARTHLATLVSRKTEDMDDQEMCRALGETLAENFNDGFIAPLFWLALGGPVALWGYKAISTADSMWGYRTPTWADLGFFGAKADDFLAWVPARLSALFLWCAGLGWGRFSSWKKIVHEAQAMDSPNAGWPMSAAAHAAQVSMGGPTNYHGTWQDKPRLGPVGLSWSTAAVRRLQRVVLVAAILGTLLITAGASCLTWWS